MKSLRCLIVDDERLACESLQAVLNSCYGVEILGSYQSVASAEKATLDLQPDILFLDVQMPGGGGFGLLGRLESPPAVIFVTAYDQFALRAFEINAVDYLLKPVAPARLAEALARVRERLQVNGSNMADTDTPPVESNDVLLLELGNSGHFRKVHDLASITADGKYTRVFCAGGRCYQVRRSLDTWLRMLPEEAFRRLDRSTVINLDHIQSIETSGRAASVLLDEGRYTIQLGRTAASRLRKLLA